MVCPALFAAKSEFHYLSQHQLPFDYLLEIHCGAGLIKRSFSL